MAEIKDATIAFIYGKNIWEAQWLPKADRPVLNSQPAPERERTELTYLALCELSEHGCQPIIINVPISFNSNIKNVNGLLTGSLQFEEHMPHK